jgi:hypothetical protein
MPNWCHNYMTIKGAAGEIARFKQTCIVNDEFDFNTVIQMPCRSILNADEPMPDDPNPAFVREWAARDSQRIDRWKEAAAFGGDPNDWAIDHWGTKWNAFRSYVTEKSDCLECSFDTAWAPPVPIFEKLGEMFPTLDFELSGAEPMNDWGFKVSVTAGKLQELHKTPLVWKTVDPKTGETVSGTREEISRVQPDGPQMVSWLSRCEEQESDHA